MNGSKIGTVITMKKIKYHTCGEEKNIYINPTGPQSGSFRVIRGGSWYDGAQYLRSACRGNFGPANRGNGVGFRLVRTPYTEPSNTLTLDGRIASAIAKMQEAIEILADK